MQPNDMQRKKIFEGKCYVANEECKLVIDSCSCENLISQNLVDHLKLKTATSNPLLHWLDKDGSKQEDHTTILFAFNIGKTYKSEVFCDLVKMDACQVLLGRPWQFDVDATHREKENTFF